MAIKKFILYILIVLSCDYLKAMNFDPNKALLVSASILNEIIDGGTTEKKGVVQFWNPITGDCIQTIEALRNPYLLNYFQCNNNTYKVLTGMKDRFQVCTKYLNSEDTVVIQSSPFDLEDPHRYGQFACSIEGLALVKDYNGIYTVLAGIRAGFVSEYDIDGNFKRSFQGQQRINGSTTVGITCLSMYQTDDGHPYVASASADGSVKICDYVTGEQVLLLTTNKYFITSMVFFKDDTGINIIAATDRCFDRYQCRIGELICWNVSSGQELYNVRYNSQGINNQQKGVCWGSIRGLILFKDELDVEHPLQVATIAADSSIKIWNAQTGEFIKNLAVERFENAWISEIRPFEEDGRVKLLVGYSDGHIAIWDVQDGAVECFTQQLPAEKNGIYAMTIFQHQGEWYCSTAGLKGGTINTWCLHDLSYVTSFQPQGIYNGSVATYQQEALNKFYQNKFSVSHGIPSGLGSAIPLFDLSNLNVVSISKSSRFKRVNQ